MIMVCELGQVRKRSLSILKYYPNVMWGFKQIYFRPQTGWQIYRLCVQYGTSYV